MKISCLIGHPVEHSVSPTLFNEFSKLTNIEYAHVKIDVDPDRDDSLEKTLSAIKELGFVGLNVTLPFKTDVIPLLDELDESAEVIGAVNTITNQNGYLKGYNTDAYGAIKTIERNLREITENDNVVILGAGGAARAVLFEVLKRTPNVTVVNRSEERLDTLANDFTKHGMNFNCILLPDTKQLIAKASEANFIINCTSVGMMPNSDKSLLPLFILNEIDDISPIKNKYFFDVIFNPAETKILDIAKEEFQATVVGGMQMMIYQGIKAFELWTEEKVNNCNVKQIENKLIEALDERS
jgi:shikimate dehydrogenase